MFELPVELIELKFVKIEFYKTYMIATPAEGITLDEEYVAKIQELASQFYGDQSFGYISNRVNDYSRNLSPKSYTRQIPHLVAFAIVYKSQRTLEIANFEKFFIHIPFQTFKKLSAAKDWMLEIIAQTKL
ncbi:hypothetical protein K8089_06490 [Aequorivita sp. F47161]|uniref:STAS/SEC14 domain-containing protein n=1 Tax=Aequorivita vitellina TaxID=2874475 RepID=A0A9X1QUN0_9FLAO|nr:hypothetical protein [Aequorivita vitellina]MCG2418665.1 hypothetical protein [Aequorivita vitellina]MCZ4319538.1 hypothetical protein [Aequorivita viscosa]